MKAALRTIHFVSSRSSARTSLLARPFVGQQAIRSSSSSTADFSNNQSQQQNLPIRRFPAHGPTEEQVKAYRTDSKTLAKWLDVSVVKSKGRAFSADQELTPATEAMTFPSIQCSNLHGENVLLPQVVSGDVKLLVFSFKHYGFTLVRSWLDPYLARFPSKQSSNHKKAIAIEICFVEYGFLSMAKNLFASSIKNNVSASQLDFTFLSFGGVTVSEPILFSALTCLTHTCFFILSDRTLRQSYYYQVCTRDMLSCWTKRIECVGRAVARRRKTRSSR